MAQQFPREPIDGGGVIGGGGSPPPLPNIPPPNTPTPPPPPVPTPSAPPVVGSAVASGSVVQAQSIPMNALPSQRLNAQLGDQPCTIDIYQKLTGLYLDLKVNDAAIVTGALCLEGNFLVRDAYLGFSGDLMMIDTQGTQDPDYTGLGARFSLIWIAPQ